jgi:hypothetical protein
MRWESEDLRYLYRNYMRLTHYEMAKHYWEFDYNRKFNKMEAL